MNDTAMSDQLRMETTLYPASSAFYGSNFSTWRDNSSQYTAGGAEPMGRLVKGIVTLLYTTIILVAVGGNVIVCCIVAVQRRMRTVTNLFIASLAASDAMMASLCIPLTFIADVIVQYWPFPAILCPVALYAQVSNLDILLQLFTFNSFLLSVLCSVLSVCDHL